MLVLLTCRFHKAVLSARFERVAAVCSCFAFLGEADRCIRSTPLCGWGVNSNWALVSSSVCSSFIDGCMTSCWRVRSTVLWWRQCFHSCFIQWFLCMSLHSVGFDLVSSFAFLLLVFRPGASSFLRLYRGSIPHRTLSVSMRSSSNPCGLESDRYRDHPQMMWVNVDDLW